MNSRPGISSIIKLIRPHQYIKNGAIFLPLFFAARITDTTLLLKTVIAFIAFSLTASAVYVLNDLLDAEDDRRHPAKKDRPIASGLITKTPALAIMATLFVAGTTLMAFVSTDAMTVLLAYVVMNVAYCFYLKHVAILDITVIAIGFALRLFVGSTATDIPLSMWIVIMTFLLALFMALAKRRDDVLIHLQTGETTRQAVAGYNLHFVDTAMAIMASVVIVAYIIYTTSIEATVPLHSERVYLTAIFVIMGIMRYMQIALVEKDSGSPTQIIMRDRFIQITLLGWVGIFAWVLY